MKRFILVAPVLLCALGLVAVACDDPKDTKTTPSATAATSVAVTPPPPASSTPPAPPPKPKKEWHCTQNVKADFEGDTALEAQVRVKLQKPTGDIMTAELPKVKSINLSPTPTDELNPCIFPTLTGFKDLFLRNGELTDLSPISAQTQMMTLVVNYVKLTDLKPIHALIHMDRLDIAHTEVRDLDPIKAMADST